MSPDVWVGMGSNQGDREAALRFGLGELQKLSVALRASKIYETEPWRLKEQPSFLNCALVLTTTLRDPLSLLGELQRIEKAAGRSRQSERWGPRILDLDLLLWGSEIITTPELTIPHPDIAHRKFVLIPLIELAPQLSYPGTDTTFRELLANCGDTGKVEYWGEF
ncbi:MAG: 2-amino-4-hydroxy-6-hydroxymethyldihydropteridine diphosphokinase [bacterium]|nr:2-amino-4-hydroxy-6-hydroxymethyldihydropteridine diphosphokinase [bacterium]